MFLDANVLVPVSLTDVLLRLAESGLLDPHWSNAVLGEARRALAHRRPGVPGTAWDRRFAAMSRAFPEALTDVDPALVETLSLPDPNDRHVLAAAIRAEATAIVTWNTKDFPSTVIKTKGIRTMTPDALLLELFGAAPERVADVLKVAAADTKRPPLTVEHILGSLAKAGATSFAAALHEWMASRAAPAPTATCVLPGPRRQSPRPVPE